MASSLEDINGIAFRSYLQEGATREDLLTLGDSLKANRSDYCFVLVGGKEEARPIVVLEKGKALTYLKAGDALKLIAAHMGGGGGGRPEMASGQVKHEAAFADAIKALKAKLQ